jgi:hypothetical protein
MLVTNFVEKRDSAQGHYSKLGNPVVIDRSALLDVNSQDFQHKIRNDY